MMNSGEIICCHTITDAKPLFRIFLRSIMTTQINSTFTFATTLGRGKVRDNYAVGEDKLLIVTSDRFVGIRRDYE